MTLIYWYEFVPYLEYYEINFTFRKRKTKFRIQIFNSRRHSRFPHLKWMLPRQTTFQISIFTIRRNSHNSSNKVALTRAVCWWIDWSTIFTRQILATDFWNFNCKALFARSSVKRHYNQGWRKHNRVHNSNNGIWLYVAIDLPSSLFSFDYPTPVIKISSTMTIKITYKKQWGGEMHITCNKGRQAHYRRDLTPYRGQIAPRPFRPTLFNLKGTFYSGVSLLTLRCLLTHPVPYPLRVAIFDVLNRCR